MSENHTFGELLKQFLARADVSYEELGKTLGTHLGTFPVHRNTIGAWVRGDRYPGSRRMLLGLASVLFLGEEEKKQLLEASKGKIVPESPENAIHSLTVHTPIWSVPYHKNPYFTGREDILLNLRHTLIAGGTAALTQPASYKRFGRNRQDANRY